MRPEEPGFFACGHTQRDFVVGAEGGAEGLLDEMGLGLGCF